MEDIQIYVGDKEASDALDAAIWKNPDKFENKNILFVSPELFPKIFSKERIRLIKALEKKPTTINELASILDRPRGAVSRDLSYLASLNLINMEKNGKERIPTRIAPISIAI
jgi:predicted transcriptional regulator